MTNFFHTIITISFLLFLLIPRVFAAGFANTELSVKELGQAFSGAPTNTYDASAVYFNPGAISHIRGKLLSIPSYMIVPSLKFTDNNSHVGEVPIRGNNGGDSAQLALIPNFYYVHELTELFSLGLAINTPFGLDNDYHAGWKGRYQAIDSELETININPVFSVRLTDTISVGAGMNVQYLHSRLTNAIDFGSVCQAQFGSDFCSGFGLLPQEVDGNFKVKGSSIGLGYNFGMLFSPNQNTRFGLSYRSRIKHKVNGNAVTYVPDKASILNSEHIFDKTRASTTVFMPDSLIFGFSHRLGKYWELSGDIIWTNWSLLKELKTEYASELTTAPQKFSWRDTWRYAVGVNYFTQSGNWVFRTGFAYDQSPVPNSKLRPIRIPDNDRYLLSVGFTRKLLSNLNLHFAYVHVFIPDSNVNSLGPNRDQLTGKFSAQVDIIGLQLDYRF